MCRWSRSLTSSVGRRERVDAGEILAVGEPLAASVSADSRAARYAR